MISQENGTENKGFGFWYNGLTSIVSSMDAKIEELRKDVASIRVNGLYSLIVAGKSTNPQDYLAEIKDISEVMNALNVGKSKIKPIGENQIYDN